MHQDHPVGTVAPMASVATLADHTDPMVQPRLLAGLMALALLAFINFYIGFTVFPQEDDGWYQMYSLVEGHAVFGAVVSDRPALAWVYKLIHVAGGGSPLRLSVINTVCWTLFAAEAAFLWCLLMPHMRWCAPVLAALVLAPLLVATQAITITFTTALLPATVAWAGVLLLLWLARSSRQPAPLLATAVLLCCVSVLLSEYGLASVICGLALLAVLSRASVPEFQGRHMLRYAAISMVCSLLAYAVFLRLATFGDVAQAKDPSTILNRFDAAVPINFLAHLWYCLLGRYGLAVGSIQPSWDSKSTIVALAAGVCIASSLFFTMKRAGQLVNLCNARLLPGLLLAVAAGLMPFILTGRNSIAGFANSRFLIPVLPAAVCATLLGGFTLLRPAFHRRWVVLLGFLCGYASVAHSATLIREHRWTSSASNQLQPLIVDSQGITLIAIEGTTKAWFHLTAKLAGKWSPQESNKLLAMPYDDVVGVVGERTGCQVPATVSVAYRGVSRVGRLTQVLLSDSTRPPVVEPYCIPKPPR